MLRAQNITCKIYCTGYCTEYFLHRILLAQNIKGALERNFRRNLGFCPNLNTYIEYQLYRIFHWILYMILYRIWFAQNITCTYVWYCRGRLGYWWLDSWRTRYAQLLKHTEYYLQPLRWKHSCLLVPQNIKVHSKYILNKLAKLGDAIAISKSETNNHSLTDPLTGVTARRCYRI